MSPQHQVAGHFEQEVSPEEDARQQTALLARGPQFMIHSQGREPDVDSL